MTDDMSSNSKPPKVEPRHNSQPAAQVTRGNLTNQTSSILALSVADDLKQVNRAHMAKFIIIAFWLR